jgi:beta-N-acetylhexosaminidase
MRGKEEMKKNGGRILAILLTVLMLAGGMPEAFVLAEDAANAPKEIAAAQDPADLAEDEEVPGEEPSDELPSDEAPAVSAEAETEEAVEADAGDAAEADAKDLAQYGSVEEILEHMTLRDKICQCLMMDFRKWKDAEGKSQDMTVLPQEVAGEIAEYRFGSIILFANNIKETQATLKLTKDMQAAVLSGGGLPLLIATDQEGGRVYRLGSGTALPGNMAIAAGGDTENAKLSAEVIGREMSALGINTTLAPVLDVNSNAGNPVIGVRSFGDDADATGSYGTAFLKGLNATDTIGCLKHFPGHGDTATDSHTGLPVVNKTKKQLYECELKPFKAAADSGADMIMTAHILYPKVDSSKLRSEKTGKDESRPATMSKTILTGILRQEMGFDGVIITDAMNMKGVADYFTKGQAAYEAFMAGADMICMPIERVETQGYINTLAESESELESFLAYIEDKAQNDPAVEARITEAAGRVIALKMEKGILDYDADEYTEERAAATVGSAENRDIERKVSAQGVTVVRNDNKLLPYRPSKNARVLMLCPYDNERAPMIMGLNRARAAGLVPKGVSVDYYTFSRNDKKIEGELKDKIDKAELVIMNSELYDAEDMSYGWYTSSVPKMITEYCKSTGTKSVVMSVSIPYDVQLYPDADAVLAVYGCKGSSMEITKELIDGAITEDTKACGPNIITGVEVIFGVFGASGHLPVNVPKFDSKTATYTDKIVYKRGYGVTYKALKPSLEHAAVSLSADTFTYNGSVQKPSVSVSDAAGRVLSEGVDYRLTNTGRRGVGEGSVRVVGIGNYTGAITATYRIVEAPAQPDNSGDKVTLSYAAKIRSVKRGKRRITVKMKKKPSKKSGIKYQIAYRPEGSNDWKYKVTYGKSLTIKKLKKGKRYEVKARAYRRSGNDIHFGAWSKTRLSGRVK